MREVEQRYKHDCEDCEFIGHHYDEFTQQDCDIYACMQRFAGATMPTVILRYGEHGDYFSGEHLLDKLPFDMRISVTEYWEQNS